jgi:feruloyl-CoA hydratase/lyase
MVTASTTANKGTARSAEIMQYQDRWKTVLVEVEAGIGWITLNRPEKRNAMSPALNLEMRHVLETLELDADAQAIVLTGAGEAWSAGMDLKEYFREIDSKPEFFEERARRDAMMWQWKLLRMYTKPTIAMVNGWCFGGAFSPLVACDLAIAANEAVFGVSEINWGIPPGNLVSKALADTIGHRNALYYIMTGEIFTGEQAAHMGLVNASVPRAQLRAGVQALAGKLLSKNPVVLRAAKHGFKRCRELTWDQNEDYLFAKLDQARQRDPEKRPGERSQAIPGRQDHKARSANLQP